MEGQDGQHVYILILFGTVGMLLLIGFIAIFIILYQKRLMQEKKDGAEKDLGYQSQMIQLQLDSEDKERKRIGTELHDSLGSLLWGAKVHVSLLERSVEFIDKDRSAYAELINILDESIEEVRRISSELTPASFHYSGLLESIEKLCNRLNINEQKVIFFCSGKIDNLSDNRAFQVFRIIQELLNNAMKHSGATIIKAEIGRNENSLVIAVCDNGSGFGETQAKNGVGLWSIHQRINQLNGILVIKNPKVGSGTEIAIEIPWIFNKLISNSS